MLNFFDFTKDFFIQALNHLAHFSFYFFSLFLYVECMLGLFFFSSCVGSALFLQPLSFFIFSAPFINNHNHQWAPSFLLHSSSVCLIKSTRHHSQLIPCCFIWRCCSHHQALHLGMAMGRGFPDPIGAPPRSGENSPPPLGNGTGAGRKTLPAAGAGENPSPARKIPAPLLIQNYIYTLLLLI